MDPEEALVNARRAAEKMDRLDTGSQGWNYAAEDLLDSVTALDEWLTKGGALPSDWHHADDEEG